MYSMFVIKKTNSFRVFTMDESGLDPVGASAAVFFFLLNQSTFLA